MSVGDQILQKRGLTAWPAANFWEFLLSVPSEQDAVGLAKPKLLFVAALLCKDGEWWAIRQAAGEVTDPRKHHLVETWSPGAELEFRAELCPNFRQPLKGRMSLQLGLVAHTVSECHPTPL